MIQLIPTRVVSAEPDMSSHPATDPDSPLASADLQHAIKDLHRIDMWFRGIFALAQKADQVAPLLNHEQELRKSIDRLQLEVEQLKALIAGGDAAQRRLDNINAELARHDAAMNSERERTHQRARADAESILVGARAKAETIVAEAKARAEEEAQRHAADADLHANAMRVLDESITERRTELDRINKHIVELRAKIGA
jgi:chromosome segregation ATPase